MRCMARERHDKIKVLSALQPGQRIAGDTLILVPEKEMVVVKRLFHRRRSLLA